VVASSSLLLVRNPLFYSPVERTRPTKAALIDEVAATNPDPYLVSNVTRTLTRVGYTVDYYGLTDITVALFRSLPSKGYGIVILRDHSTSLTGDVIALVTSEPFDSGKYVNERLTGKVIPVPLNNSTYFGITPTFVRESMQGTFPNTLLVVMGCAGLANSEMAQAFVAKGIEVYISWNHIVLTNQSDGGAILLLQSMTTGHRVDEAVTWATENAPSNEAFPSQLEYYPLDQGGLVLNLGGMKLSRSFSSASTELLLVRH
jgi:hypothetical protein